MTPCRIQLRRTKGWRMPANTVIVSRPTSWGNPFVVCEGDFAFAVAAFRRWLAGDERPYLDGRRHMLLSRLPVLRGQNLACWCPPDRPCHADVLLELANPMITTGRPTK